MNRKEQHIIDELKQVKTPLPSDDYFLQLKSGILAKLPESNRRIVPFYKKWWTISSAAASVILIVGFLFMQQEAPVKPASKAGPDWSSVSKEDVLAYIEENIDDFEPETIAAQLSQLPEWELSLPASENKASSPAVKTNTKSTDALFDELEDKEILEYLHEEAIDIDDELLIGS